jgi:uncharacterized protein (TIGR02300 family)
LLLTDSLVHGIGKSISSAIKEDDVAKPDLGIKRTCTGCGARFYDLARDPIICPKCETTFDPTAQTRSSRSKAPAAPAAPKKPKPAPVADTVEAEDDDVLADDDLGDAAIIDDVDDDGEDEAAIEDASELGEDKDDMFEVIEKVVVTDEDAR